MTDADMSKIYFIIGSMVVVNFGAIFAFLFGAFKLTVKLTAFITTLDLKTDKAQETGVRAHKRIDQLEKLSISTE